MRKVLKLILLRVSRLWKTMFLISGIATAIGYGMYLVDFLDMSGDELAAYDSGLKSFHNKPWFPWAEIPVNEDVVLVAIDDATFNDVAAHPPYRDRYGSWPFDRIIWRDVLEYLSEAGAKLVVMDVTMSEPKADITGDQKFGEMVGQAEVPLVMGFNALPLVPELPKVEKPSNRIHVRLAPPKEEPPSAPGGGEETFPGGDEFPTEPDPAQQAKALEEAAAKLRERAALAYAFPASWQGGLDRRLFKPVAHVALPDGGVPTGEDLARHANLLVATELPRFPLPSIEPLIDVVGGFGAVEVEADEDGKMRATRFVYSDGKNDYLTLAVAAAADYYGAKEVSVSPQVLKIGDHAVRVDADGSARLNYRGELKDRFRSVPLVDVLRYKGSKDDPAMWAAGLQRFKGKVVFIGAIAQGTGDEKATPFSAAEPGVMKQMTVFDNIVHDRFIREAPIWWSLLLAFVVALFSVALVMVAQSVVTDIGAPVFLYFAFFVLTGSFITLTNIHILSAMPGMAGTLAAVAATAFNRFLASKDREFMRKAFSAYMEEDLVEQMVEGRRLPALDGEECEVTAFFSDIKGFSSFSEALKDDPKRLMRILNRYLSAVTPVIKKEGACIDKYIGDAVVALFGAPVAYEDHALRACRAALKVQETVGELRKAFAAEGLPDVYTRIGLNSDKMLVGNIGSDDLLDYTALGDGMNLAARLEGTNKAYETLILIGPKTYEAVKDQVVARELDWIRVAGKQQILAVYELVGMKGAVPAQKLQLHELYAQALALYRQRHFAEAHGTLKQAHELDKTDGPTKVLGTRCNRFAQQPPPEGWDGVTAVDK